MFFQYNQKLVMKVLFTVSSAAARLHVKNDEALIFNREQWSDNQDRGNWLSHVASRALKKDHNGIVKTLETLGARASNISLLLGVKPPIPPIPVDYSISR